jgi:hypothetical protein
MKVRIVLSPDEHSEVAERIQKIFDFWDDLRDSEESGAATWDELERLGQEVKNCLETDSPDVNLAESITAYAMLLITGDLET